MTDMNSLIAWLRAQLDDDERVAREALHPDAVSPGVWTTEHHNPETHECHIAEDRSGHYWSVAHEVFIPNAEHMARWDPARVLAEVDAKRRILDAYDDAVRMHRLMDETDSDAKWDWLYKSEALEGVVKVLALPYAGHPDYREEWRP